MEQQQSSLFSNLSFDGAAKQILKAVANTGFLWTLISMISSVLGFISYFVKKDEYEALRRYSTDSVSTGPNLFSLVISLGISILLFTYMNKFNSLTKSAIETNNQDQMNEGLRNLKNYFWVTGIILIIALVLITLGVLIALLAAAS